MAAACLGSWPALTNSAMLASITSFEEPFFNGIVSVQSGNHGVPRATAIDLFARHDPLAVQVQAFGQVELFAVGFQMRRPWMLARVRVLPDAFGDSDLLLPRGLQGRGRLGRLVAR